MITYNENETAEAAAKLAPQVKQGDIILLRGPLGAGKSVFVRTLIRSLANEPDLEVPSPTFTIVQTYDTQRGVIWHFDLYRLKEAEEIYETGWEEALSGGIVIVEWPERLGALLPASCLDIHLKAVENEPNSRQIEITRT